ncbi:MAG: hypothetical protein HY820_18880 [Acidobacteria bacterium]|nr:hypothetical protein [Acidobacteriota bacterium]
MRHLHLNPTSETLFPTGACEPHPDFGSPLGNGLYALWLPTRDPRMWFNPWRLNAKRAAIPFEYSPAYFQRRMLFGAPPSGLAVPTGSGGNIPTPFGAALACSNEQVGWSGSSLADAPAFTGDGTGKTISVCVWFRINRLNGTGFPTICSTSYTTGWWLGLRTSTGKYKAIFRNSTSPYGPFEWGAYSGDFRKVSCVSFVLPLDANTTASVYHNGVLAVQGTITNASSASGSASVFPLSSSTPGMFVEIFGIASWTRALYPDEMRQLVSGPRVLLAKRQNFWYGPLLAYRVAQVAGGSGIASDRRVGVARTVEVPGNGSYFATGFRGLSRMALIAGASSLIAHLTAGPSLLRTWLIRREARSMSIPEEPRTITVSSEKRTLDA